MKTEDSEINIDKYRKLVQTYINLVCLLHIFLFEEFTNNYFILAYV